MLNLDYEHQLYIESQSYSSIKYKYDIWYKSGYVIYLKYENVQTYKMSFID